MLIFQSKIKSIQLRLQGGNILMWKNWLQKIALKKKHDDDSIGDDTGNINDINKTWAPDFTTAT